MYLSSTFWRGSMHVCNMRLSNSDEELIMELHRLHGSDMPGILFDTWLTRNTLRVYLIEPGAKEAPRKLKAKELQRICEID